MTKKGIFFTSANTATTSIRRKLSVFGFLLCPFLFLQAQTVQYHQLSFYNGGPFYSDSDWGAADVTFMGTSEVLYFNLTVGTNWVVENMPILSVQGNNVTQTQRIWFDIGDSGVYVSNINCGFSLQSYTISAKPALTGTASVTSKVVYNYSGASGSKGTGAPPPTAKNQKGGQVTASAVPTNHSGFPNQECGKNDCVPVAISNSLQWLNSYYSLNMDTAAISLSALRTGLKKGPNGVDTNKIVPYKRAYTQAQKLPITTHQIRGDQSKQFEKVIDEMNKGQDVELILKKLDGGFHAVSITGIAQTGTGKFAITISEDSQQGCAGGTVSEPATYDRGNHLWGESLVYASGEPYNFFFIVECPVKQNNSNSKNIPGGTAHKLVPNRVAPLGNNKFHLQNLQLGGYSNNVPPPALGNSTTLSVSGSASLDFSSDSGVTFQNFAAPYSAVMNFKHTLDSSNATEYYKTEILSLSLSGGTLPANIKVQESPALADSSVGLMAVHQSSPGVYTIFSFFDVFFELSTNGGTTWLKADNQTNVLYMEDTLVITSLPPIQSKGNIKYTTLFLSESNSVFAINGVADGGRLVIYNAMGQVMFQCDNYKNDFPVSTLPGGMYFFSLQPNNDEMHCGKFILQ